MSWTLKKDGLSISYYRDDGCFVAAYFGGDVARRWYYKTRTGKLSYGPFDTARLARAEADRRHPQRRNVTGVIAILCTLLTLPIHAQTYNTPSQLPVPSDAELIVRGFHTTDLVWRLGEQWYVTKFGVTATPGATVVRTIYMPEPAMERARRMLALSPVLHTAALQSTSPAEVVPPSPDTCLGNPVWLKNMNYYAGFQDYGYVEYLCTELASRYYRQNTAPGEYVELDFAKWLTLQFGPNARPLYDSPGVKCPVELPLHRPDGIGEHANAARVVYRGYKTVEGTVVAVPIGARDYTVAIMLPCVRQPGARIVSVEWLTLVDPQGVDWGK